MISPRKKKKQSRGESTVSDNVQQSSDSKKDAFYLEVERQLEVLSLNDDYTRRFSDAAVATGLHDCIKKCKDSDILRLSEQVMEKVKHNEAEKLSQVPATWPPSTSRLATGGGPGKVDLGTLDLLTLAKDQYLTDVSIEISLTSVVQQSDRRAIVHLSRHLPF